jgi:Family of unknown function (DUF5329)
MTTPAPATTRRAALRRAVAAAGAALGLAAGARLQAAPAADVVRAEIGALLDALAASGCEFNRNGTWHGAAEARTHLLRKLGELERRGTPASTEQFIELGASASSLSGRAYRVRCAGAPEVDSRAWLLGRLAELRRAPK